MKRKFGFTLIELLVVMSIVGLISSILLGSLKTSRDKAIDARIKQQLVEVRKAASIYFSNNGTFGQTNGFDGLGSSELCSDVGAMAGTVFSDSTLTDLTSPNNYQYGELYCGSNITTFAIAAQLSNNNPWCVDSTGFSGFIGDGSVIYSTCN